jgi:hypothetical protein
MTKIMQLKQRTKQEKIDTVLSLIAQKQAEKDKLEAEIADLQAVVAELQKTYFDKGFELFKKYILLI